MRSWPSLGSGDISTIRNASAPMTRAPRCAAGELRASGLRSAPCVICAAASSIFADRKVNRIVHQTVIRADLQKHDAAASRPKQSSSKNGQVAARATQHHSATLVSGAGVPPHCLEAVYSRLQAVQLVSDCCFWRLVHSNYLLVAEYAYGPPPGSAHFLFSLIENSRS